MEQELLMLFEEAKKDKKKFKSLKEIAVKCNQFDLAVKLRDMESTLFHETKEEKSAKLLAGKLNLVFRMVELNISEEACWLIYETLKIYNKKGEAFSVSDSVELVSKMKRFFD